MSIPISVPALSHSPLDRLILCRIEAEEDLGRPLKHNLMLFSHRNGLVLRGRLGRLATIDLALLGWTAPRRETRRGQMHGCTDLGNTPAHDSNSQRSVIQRRKEGGARSHG